MLEQLIYPPVGYDNMETQLLSFSLSPGVTLALRLGARWKNQQSSGPAQTYGNSYQWDSRMGKCLKAIRELQSPSRPNRIRTKLLTFLDNHLICKPLASSSESLSHHENEAEK